MEATTGGTGRGTVGWAAVLAAGREPATEGRGPTWAATPVLGTGGAGVEVVVPAPDVVTAGASSGACRGRPMPPSVVPVGASDTVPSVGPATSPRGAGSAATGNLAPELSRVLLASIPGTTTSSGGGAQPDAKRSVATMLAATVATRPFRRDIRVLSVERTLSRQACTRADCAVKDLNDFRPGGLRHDR
jgi:hypothetical protein